VFSPGAEIEEYLESVARQYGIDKVITFGAEVLQMVFTDGAWDLEISGGRQDRAHVVIAATGVLHHPHLPPLEGLDQFAGACFHSARWDHRVPLDGQRIGIVGTGSSAVQITTAIVDRVAELHLFQRTAQWVVAAANPKVADEERVRLQHDPAAIAEIRAGLSQAFEEGFSRAVVDADSPALKILEDLCRANLEEHVSDLELREQLRPDYRAACKRLIVSPAFYQAITQPQAQLVTSPIERVETAGVRTRDGLLHELDVLVLATGFRVDRFLRPIKVVGRDGVDLDDVWAERPSAYLSLSVPDFPNLFMLNGPNGPVGNFSLIEVAELQFDYILQLVDRIRSGACREICATQQAMEDFEAARVEAAQKTIWITGCRSWYLDDRGIPAVWPWPFERFRAEMRSPQLANFEVR
jgi:cation diffusion facilitator CzcD-associated flavoprotein CzcO